jgi:hypothetical protein
MRISFEQLVKIKEEFGDYDISKVIGGSNDFYFRFGYWRPVDANKLQEIIGESSLVVEDDIYDDDCGYLFSYKIKDKIFG